MPDDFVDDLGSDELEDERDGYDPPTPLEVLAGLFRVLDEREPWRLRAACRGAGTRTFFGSGDGLGAYWRSVSARLCGGCSVRRECLEFALRVEDADDLVGVFGGTDPKSRRELRSSARLGSRQTA